MVMQQYNLQRRWFTYSQLSQLKLWVNEAKDADIGHFASIVKVNTEKGKGLSVSVGKAAGYSMADVLYSSLGCPDYMIYVNRLDDGRLWFAFAFDGHLMSDVVINDEYFASSKYTSELMKLMQEFERFSKVAGHKVMVYSSNCNVDDAGNLAFFNLFCVPPRFEYEIHDYLLDGTQAVDALEDQTNYQLNRIADLRYPKNWQVLGPVMGVVGFALLYMITPDINFEEMFKEEEVQEVVIQPPIIIDTFKDLKLRLTESGIGVKQRFIYIVNEIYNANQVPGWRVESYKASSDTGYMMLTRTFGQVEHLKRVFPESHYYMDGTLTGVRVVRKIPTFPILSEPVRANVRAEEIWLSNAIEWVWGDKAKVTVAAPKKENAKNSYIEKEMTVQLDDVFNEDLDSLSSLFVGRSTDFTEFKFNYNEGSSSYSCELKVSLIGVPDELYGIEKR